MLEILGIIFFTRHLSSVARLKGRSGWWGGFGALGWIGGEMMGGCIAGCAGVEGLGVYLVAVVGAAVGALLAWALVSLVPTVQGFDPVSEMSGASGVVECPRCGSLQTEVVGGSSPGNACECVGESAPWGPPAGWARQ